MDIPAVDAVAATCCYNEGARKVVLSAKFVAQRQALAWMGQQMVNCVPTAWQLEAIVPMPIAHARLRRRGFNQTHFLATELSRRLQLPVAKKMLKKRNQQAQSLQDSLAARRKNIRGAFIALPPVTERVLLVDDVSTSGATLQEAAKVLKQAGVRWVAAVVFAAVMQRS